MWLMLLVTDAAEPSSASTDTCVVPMSSTYGVML